MMRRIRIVAILVAAAASIAAVALWLGDGAWEYGAMPTKGVVRTLLFAGGGCLVLLAGTAVGHYGRRISKENADATRDD